MGIQIAVFLVLTVSWTWYLWVGLAKAEFEWGLQILLL